MIIKKNALTQEECTKLIDISKSNMVAAKTCGEHIEGYRVANNTWIYEDNEITKKIKKIISEETNLPKENQEAINIIHYGIGGEYKKHYDFFHKNTSYYDKQIIRGGNRVFTALFYLNDDFKGGETEFVNMQLKISPEIGKLIIWKNMNDDKTLNKNSFHAGLPVIEGEKYICVVWIRENEFK
jgi:prolyl 4-hydroxylase